MGTGAKGKGETIQYTNTGSAITGGDVVIVGNLVCIAAEDIAASTGVGTLWVTGRHAATKATGAAIGQGETVIYDVSASNFDDNAATPAAGDVTAGAWAPEAAGTGTTSFDIVLSPGAGTVT